MATQISPLDDNLFGLYVIDDLNPESVSPMQSKRWPISIMSFNRPMYLEAVLRSLLKQRGVEIAKHSVTLFQDGAVNLHSGNRYAEDRDIFKCVEVFQKLIPHGVVADYSQNLGVAWNFARAESHCFEEIDSEVGIFLEDDMILDEKYFEVLDDMIGLALYDDRMGYVCAYGNHELTPEQQTSSPTGFFLMEHNWAFALLRRQFKINKPYVDQYLGLIKNTDYRARSSEKIHSLFRSWGMGCPGDSQDVAKTIACCLNETVKLNIRACLGKYIGREGLHMNTTMYDEKRYDATQMYPSDLSVSEPLNKQDFNRIFATQVNWATEHP